LSYAEGYRQDTGLIATKKLTDNLEFDKKTFEFSENTGLSGEAGITATYDLTSSYAIDKMIAQIYYTQNPTMLLEYSDDSTTWSTIYDFTMPIHGGSGRWEDIIWKLADSEISAPNDITSSIMGASDTLATYSYKITALTYLGETTAQTITVSNANSTLNTLSYVRLTWHPVSGAISYNIYGRVSGSETLLANVVPATSPVVYDDKGSGPVLGAPSAPIINTSANLGSHRYYRLSLKDELDINLPDVITRVVRFGDFRIYNNNIQYSLPEKLSASEIEYPGFKSFIINATGLSTSTTYALVARELDSEEATITDPDMHIIKWFRTNL
jgi:hypothetical protein